MTNLVQREHARITELLPGCKDHAIWVYLYQHSVSSTTLRIRVEQGSVKLRLQDGRLYDVDKVELERQHAKMRVAAAKVIQGLYEQQTGISTAAGMRKLLEAKDCFVRAKLG